MIHDKDEKLELRRGQYLYSSCSATYYEILRVGEDANGHPIIDLAIEDINDFIDERWEDSSGLMEVVIPEGPSVVFKDLQYRNLHRYEDMILVECNAPGNGCYRCTSSFIVKENQE